MKTSNAIFFGFVVFCATIIFSVKSCEKDNKNNKTSQCIDNIISAAKKNKEKILINDAKIICQSL